MKRFEFVVLAICLAVQSVQLGRCAGPAALESQAKQRDARLARMYFLRESRLVALYGSAATTEIKVDGTPVGAVIGGTYFFVDRPPGTYKLSAELGPLTMAFEAETRVEAGQTYYFGIGVPRSAAIGQDLVNQAVGGSSGQQMRSTSPLMGGFSAIALYQLDPPSGAAAIAQLKAQ
jgi:hypothetical protein